MIMPNAELVKSTIKNIKRLERRGVSFKLNVRYDAPKKKLDAIPGMIREIIEKQPNVTFDRCHLITLGDYSLIFEVLYFIDSSDYKLYLDTQQKIIREILDSFENQGIEFAFPGQAFLQQPQLDTAAKK